ncbi:MAG: hypothetical protein RLZZ127_3199, partial [Planctomycetota bacterium]
MRLTTIVPALACLMPVLYAGDARERDAHLEAIKALIDAEMPIPAVRQLGEFAAAGYPDDGGLVAATITWYAGDRLLTRMSGPRANDLQGRFDKAKAAVEAAAKAGKLPTAAKQIWDAAGTPTQRLATEIMKVIGPDKPKPVGGAAVITPEARERIGRAVAALAKNLLPAFNDAVAKVDANLKDEEEAWNLDEKKDAKRLDEINERAVNLRYAALFDAWLSMIALREVAMRGAEFGIPDGVLKEADAAIAGLLTARAAMASNPTNDTNLQMMQSWDFNWGERNGYITLFAQSLIGEGVRLKVKGASADDVQGELVKIASLDAAKTVPEARFRPMFLALQLKCWNAVFRLRL